MLLFMVRVSIMKVMSLFVLERLLVMGSLVVLSSRSRVDMVLVLGGLAGAGVVSGTVLDGLVRVGRLLAFVMAVMELVGLGMLVLGVAVVDLAVSMAYILILVLRVVVGVASHFLVVDHRSIVSMDVDIFVMHGSLVRGLVARGLVVRGLNMGSLVMRGLNMGSLVMRGLVFNGLGVMVDSLVRSLGVVVCVSMMGVFVKGLLVMDDLVVEREVTGVAIVVIHLEDEAALLDVDLAGHEEGGVVLEAPVVAGVPLLGVKRVEVVSPAQLEILSVVVVVMNFNEVVLGVPGHLGIIEIVVPWRPARSPEVHHELSRHVEEVHILLTFALADQLVVDVPGDLVGSPLDGVGKPVRARVEAGGVGVILGTVLPDNVH